MEKTTIRTEFDFIPFLVGACAYAKGLHPMIDETYEKNIMVYYEAAINSPYYGHYLCSQSSLEFEYYFNKVLGIFAADNEMLFSMLKRAYKKCYRLAELYCSDRKAYGQENTHDLVTFSKDSDEYLLYLIVTYCFFINLLTFDDEENIEEDQLYLSKLLNTVAQMNGFYTGQKEFQIAKIPNRVPDQNRKQISQLKRLMRPDFLSWFKKNNKSDLVGNAYEFLFDQEEISSVSVYDSIDAVTTRDLDAALLCYFISNGGKTEVNPRELEFFCTGALHIKLWIRAYRKCKEDYFKNNAQISNLEANYYKYKANSAVCEEKRKTAALEAKIAKLEEENRKLKEQNDILEKKNQQMEASVSKMEEPLFELAHLRNFVYDLREEPVLEDNASLEEKTSSIRSKMIVVFGGPPAWQQRMKELFPDWQYIGLEHSLNTNIKDILQNTDGVGIYTRYLTHKLYVPLIEQLRTLKIPYCYLNSSNINQTTTELAKMLAF